MLKAEDKSEKQPLASEENLNKLKDLIDFALDAHKGGHYVEAFLFAAQVIENLMMPVLRLEVMEKLGIKAYASLVDKQNFYQANMVYLALSQDLELFTLLEKFRKVRNKLMHKLVRFDNIEIVQREAKEGMKLFAKIFAEIDDRGRGVKPIPVLTLYAKGWNERGEYVRKRIIEATEVT